MRTTVSLDAPLLEQARREAAKRGTTVTALIESGLRRELAHPLPSEERQPVRLIVCTAGGGTLPGVNLDDSPALLDLMDGLD